MNVCEMFTATEIDPIVELSLTLIVLVTPVVLLSGIGRLGATE